MRPLPRLFAFTDETIRLSRRTPASAAAIASLGAPVALVARDHLATGAELTEFTAALHIITRPAGAALIVGGRPEIASALGAQGIQLRALDLSPVDARTVFQIGWIGRSVHSVDEAKMAVDEGADYVVAGPVFETPTHPGMTPWGISLIQKVSQLNLPVIAIGGMTPERSQHVFEAGAWGVAAISALWKTVKPAEAASQMLQPWM